MCTNRERGCEWQGDLSDINNHLENSDGCRFEEVKCFNVCGRMLQRQDLASHAETECPCRKVDCQYCHITGEYQFIEGEHKEQCPKFPLPCPNNCKVSCTSGRKRRANPYSKQVIRYISREDMEAHRDECPLEDVECFLLCGKMLKRQHLINHVAKKCPHRKVECQYCDIPGNFQFIKGKHKEQCPKLPLPCPNKCGIGSFPREDMEAHRKECPLEMVQCTYHSVGCEDRMMRKDLSTHKEEKIEKHLSLTTSQLASALKHIDTLMVALHPVVPQVNYNCRTRPRHATSPAVVEAQWSLKLKGRAAMIRSADPVCPAVFHITHLNKKRTTQTIWYSDPFYSHDKGYKMCMGVWVAGNGSGKGTHLSLFLYLMKGPHDDDLTWPMRGKFEVKLLNQISDCEHHARTINYDDHTSEDIVARVTDGDKAKCGWGFQKYILIEDIHKSTSFVKDDSVFFIISKLH